jgi:hypothetical protein
VNGPSTATAATADRIRIEDEVWEEAFASRVSSRPRRPVALKTRPAESWFAEPYDALGPVEVARPYGVDPPVEFGPPFAPEPGAPPAPYGVETPSASAAPREVRRESGRPSRAPASAALARRTIQIEGRGTERNLVLTGRDTHAATRPRRSLFDHRSGFEPDRLAMWAMLLGLALMAVAILSSSL